MKIFLTGPMPIGSYDEEKLDDVQRPLVRSAILTIKVQFVRSRFQLPVLDFVCPMAKQFFFRRIFPDGNMENTAYVLEARGIEWLIEESVKAFDQHRLSGIVTIEGDRFPKEAVFQQQFFPAIVKLLHPSITVVPEKSTESKSGETGCAMRLGFVRSALHSPALSAHMRSTCMHTRRST